MGKKGGGGKRASASSVASVSTSETVATYTFARGLAVTLAVAMGLLRSVLRAPTIADTATLEGLIARSANGGDLDSILGSVAAPSAVPRVQWDPNEPLAPWLGRLHVPVVFNASQIDRWPARLDFTLDFLERELPTMLKADVSKSSGTMVYRDNKMQAVELAKSLGNSVGLRTHTTKQIPKEDFFQAVRSGEPFVRHGGGLAAWAGGDTKLVDHVPDWQALAADPPPHFDQSLLDPHDVAVLVPRKSQIGARQLDIWIGGAGIRTTAHLDPHNNVFTQIHGVKRFVLSPPSDYRHFDMFPTTHPHTRQAQTHYDNAPSGLNVRCMTVDLQPGELLWLPAFWVHAVDALTPTISVSVVSPGTESLLFENIQAGGLLTTMPFLGGKTVGWDVFRLASTFRVFIPALLKGMESRLGEDFDVLEVIKQRMWSPAVRQDLGVNANARFPCGETAPEDKDAALAAVPRAVARFAPLRDETLGIFVVMYIELLQSHIKLPLGVGFLEQCLDGTQYSGDE